MEQGRKKPIFAGKKGIEPQKLALFKKAQKEQYGTRKKV